MNLKEQILKLHSEGYSYRQIEEKLGCSKGTISFHLGPGQKEKSLLRQRKNRAGKEGERKIEHFKSLTPAQKKGRANKVVHFCRDTPGANPFTLKQVFDKYKGRCYLTGRYIDINEHTSYSLDHIVSRAKGGDNSFENCGLTDSLVNRAKADMTLEEFFQMCIDVVKHNKLDVT
jgi:CRISPR/Cas system Type II protein with McrA/HNH and RuvC-like nuclease domain